MTPHQLRAPTGQRPYALAPPPPAGAPHISPPPPGVLPEPPAEHPGVVGSLWPPPSEYGPPPALMQWRARRRPLWAWSPRSLVLTVAAAGSVLGAVGLLLV